jgi:nucleoside-diphosphate-sugar epimerase
MKDAYHGRRVLITGGLGFIGSNLAIELCRLGATVTVVDLPVSESASQWRNVEPVLQQMTICLHDIRDETVIESYLRNQDYVFCLAGQVSHSASMRRPLEDLDVNCRSYVTLLEVCRKVNPTARIVFASTRQVYGKPFCLPVPEMHPIQPVDVNGINKRAAESYFALYSKVYGLSTLCLRLTNTYGPRMDITNYTKGFVGVFLGQALQGHAIRVFGDGRQRRDFNYVSDVVDAFLLAGAHRQASGECFNLGHEKHYSINELLETLSKHLPVTFEHVPFPPDLLAIEIGDCYCDFSAFHRLTQWSPRVDLEEGLERTLAYFRETEKRLRC